MSNDSRQSLEDVLARRRPEREAIDKEFDRVAARFESAKEKYPDGIPVSIQLDIVTDHMFVSTRSNRLFLAEHAMSPNDCIAVHGNMPSVEEIDDIKTDLSKLRDTVREVRSSMPKGNILTKMQSAAFWITALCVVCVTIWGVHTIDAIPPEFRQSAFESVVEVLKIQVDKNHDD